MLGRRRAMSTECGVFIIGVIVQICSFDAWPQFAVGRLISGLGIGALSAAVVASIITWAVYRATALLPPARKARALRWWHRRCAASVSRSKLSRASWKPS